MSKFEELLQRADWKNEKHVPVIKVLSDAKAGEDIKVKVGVGEEVGHPNETNHHIRWIELYFKPEDGKFPIQLGRYEFGAHGASAKGPDTSGVYSHHAVKAFFRTEKPGTLYAFSYCNIHGLWTNSEELSF